MKTEILFDILFRLLANKTVKAEQIALDYNVSARTAYRYMDELSTIIPIYAERGRNGGYSVVDSYMLPAGCLTEKEYTYVLQALEAFREELPGEALTSAINKICASSKHSKEFSLNSSTLMIDSGPWGVTADYNNKLRVLEDCVATGKVARLFYRNVNGEQSERDIEPHTLVLKQGIWYVYAYCRLRCEFRLFKVGRIESIIVRDECFERRDTDDLKNVFGYRGKATDKYRVVMEISPVIASEIEEWLGVECVKREGERLTAVADLPLDGGLVSKILGYGGRIKVLEPKKLAESIKSKAEEIVAQYK